MQVSRDVIFDEAGMTINEKWSEPMEEQQEEGREHFSADHMETYDDEGAGE